MKHTMSWLFAGISLTAAVICLAIASVVLLRDQRNSVNRVFAALCLFVAWWAFVQFQSRQAPDAATAAFWIKATAPWPLVEALLLHFALVFTERARLLRLKWTYVIVYLPAIAIAVVDLTTRWITGPPVRAYWGWTSRYLGTPMNGVADAFILAWALAAIFLCFDYYRRQQNATLRQRALWALIGISASVAIAIGTDVLLPRFVAAPEFGPPAAALGVACCAGWAMWRYQLFAITPATAADSIISTMSDSLLLTDLDGSILTANRAAAELLGQTAKKLAGTNIAGILRGEEDPELQRMLGDGEALRGNGEREVVIKSATRGEVPVSLAWSVMRADTGGPMGIVWIARDITERKQIESIKSDLVAMVSHDLRNPVGIIVSKAGVAERLLKDGRPDERCLNAVRQVQAQAAGMRELVDNLLDVYRLEMGDLSPLLEDVDLVALLRRQVEQLEITRSHQLALDVATGLPLVRCDPRRISIAIRSLLENALRFSPGGGAIVLGACRENGHVQVSVSDEGLGISRENRERIFERFEQGDTSVRREYRGLGVGLYLVREIMKAHGGSVSVESTPGKGSVFTLHIPVRPPRERKQELSANGRG